jgi:hypothetical protein
MFRQHKSITWLGGFLVSLGLSVCVPLAAFSSEINSAIPLPQVDNPKTSGPLQTAVSAGGCFWGVHAFSNMFEA